DSHFRLDVTGQVVGQFGLTHVGADVIDIDSLFRIRMAQGQDADIHRSAGVGSGLRTRAQRQQEATIVGQQQSLSQHQLNHTQVERHAVDQRGDAVDVQHRLPEGTVVVVATAAQAAGGVV